MTPKEQLDLVDMVAQAVVDRMEQAQQINHLTDMVVKRVLEMQRAEAAKAAEIPPTEADESASSAE